MISDSWIVLYLIGLPRFPSRKVNPLCLKSLYRRTLIRQRQGYDALVKLCRKGMRAQQEMAQETLNRWRGDVTALLSGIGLEAA